MITEGLKGRDFLCLQDFTKEEIDTMLELALQFKADKTMRRRHDDILSIRTLFMMFFNASLRSRNSFEAGIFQLGCPYASKENVTEQSSIIGQS